MNDSYLFDSSVLSALLRPGLRRDAVISWLKSNPGQYATSVVVICEIESGLMHKDYTDMLVLFHEQLAILDVTVIDVTREITTLAARHRAQAFKKGLTYHAEDLLIGATALYHSHCLLTANTKDFNSWVSNIENPLK